MLWPDVCIKLMYDHSVILVVFEQHCHRVRMGPGKPGKSWNFIVAFSRTGESWKRTTGPGKFWKSVKLKSKNMKCMADI